MLLMNLISFDLINKERKYALLKKSTMKKLQRQTRIGIGECVICVGICVSEEVILLAYFGIMYLV